MNRCFQRILLVSTAGLILSGFACLQTIAAQTGKDVVLIGKPFEKKSSNKNSAQSAAKANSPTAVCAKPSNVAYGKLSDYVNDFNRRRDGECVVVRDVPLFSGIRNAEDEYGNHRGLYYLENEGETDVGSSFATSPTLARDLRPFLKKEAASLRVTTVLIRFSDEFEVFRSPYATKVEGLDENGQVLWTVTGKLPTKLKFPV